MKHFGLIGFPLGHSFSQKYFTEKFKTLGISNTHSYELFEMEDLDLFPKLWEDKNLLGVNVTVPHKQAIKPFLDTLDSSAEKVGAVNVIKRKNDKLVGYNSDYYGFKKSLEHFVPDLQQMSQALVLGGGGAAKAVEAALKDLGIEYSVVSRTSGKEDLIYADLNEVAIFQKYQLIINTTPLGMHPNLLEKPALPYDLIRPEQYLFDLVYNPEETSFMKAGKARGAQVQNGLEMLHLQADKAWEIWSN